MILKVVFLEKLKDHFQKARVKKSKHTSTESSKNTPGVEKFFGSGIEREPLVPEPNILTTRQKEFPMSGGGYWLIYIRVRWCTTGATPACLILSECKGSGNCTSVCCVHMRRLLPLLFMLRHVQVLCYEMRHRLFELGELCCCSAAIW
ncbi:hypothetical protein AVEN_274829-1 [Araneus ventricosus]|uniref:Uncharacterized protein n=1 Tax=Araneus ventricosus TaxID=182803 RepID=A0A4Y2WSW7_ARAVE|nr:hypothetical protein AVEN_274829-1 [Araneus ventricosus]